MNSAKGRSLELYYVDGQPDGMVTAELFNWTGHVLMTPRTQIAAALKRTEASYAGVYILIGEEDGEPRAYVGEGEDIAERLRAHDGRKEWWTSAILVTAAANKLNKAHVRYLEARLIAEARATGRVPLDNATIPSVPSLSEADIAKMEAFLENLLVVLPAVRVDLFIQRSRPAAKIDAMLSAESKSQRFTLDYPKHALRASAVLDNGEFIVEAGSAARAEWAGHESHTYAPLFAELIRARVLARRDDHNMFTQNYAFRSPSAAAAIIYGRSANGQIAWRADPGGLTYRDWEALQLKQEATA